MKKFLLLPAMLFATTLCFAQRPDDAFNLSQNNYDDLKGKPHVKPVDENEITRRIMESEIENTLKIYPNPAKNNMTVFTGSYLPHSVKIIDLTGRIVLQLSEADINTSQITLDVSALLPGIYFVQLDFNPIQMAKKIIVCE